MNGMSARRGGGLIAIAVVTTAIALIGGPTVVSRGLEFAKSVEWNADVAEEECDVVMANGTEARGPRREDGRCHAADLSVVR